MGVLQRTAQSIGGGLHSAQQLAAAAAAAAAGTGMLSWVMQCARLTDNAKAK